jgi:hypothetical protein
VRESSTMAFWTLRARIAKVRAFVELAAPRLRAVLGELGGL